MTDTLERIAVALEAIAESMNKEAADPAENWCTATTQEGRRCVGLAAKDGLCRTHWRLARTRPMTDAMIELVFQIIGGRTLRVDEIELESGMSRPAVNLALKELIAAGSTVRLGSGKPGDPFRYTAPPADE
ncbi:MAG: hypothetical protein OXC10_06640 [Rhodospirillaceae bacterium]|nr:hypothetical protein [Rhodospirillaceae bacterium]